MHVIARVQPPRSHTDGIDDKRIAFPVTHSVSHKRTAGPIRVQIFRMRPAIHWNGTIKMIVFVVNREIFIPLDELLRMRREGDSRHTIVDSRAAADRHEWGLRSFPD